MLDRLIRGGVLIDGTGAPRRTADIGIKDGRIAAIGRITQSARETVDADGAIVAPGFIDIHTHYDAQLLWDKAVTPSCFHGVTTIVGGNCGFTIAPLAGDGGRYIRRMLARVEGMPLEALEAGGAWGWQSFGDYLDTVDQGLGINAGFLVGHSALRRVVMGDAAVGERATPAQIEAMTSLLGESLRAGGLGLSSGRTPVHQDMEGERVPSFHASDEELFALCRTVRAHPGTTLEFAPSLSEFEATGELDDRDVPRGGAAHQLERPDRECAEARRLSAPARPLGPGSRARGAGRAALRPASDGVLRRFREPLLLRRTPGLREES